MNNNRGNNRRRGRGSNRQQGNQPLNRIDSRARGNAPQLLEKYRKLAHDSHLNGDRVQEEYYLQFADHYFRVIADQRQRQDEARQRREDRYQDGGDYDRDDDARGPGADGDYEDRGRDAGGADGDEPGSESENEERSPYEPAENPFVRDNRSTREARRRKPRSDSRDQDDGGEEPETEARSPRGVDPSVLPPSIGANSARDDAGDDEDAEPKPRRRTRRQRPESDSGEALEAVS